MCVQHYQFVELIHLLRLYLFQRIGGIVKLGLPFLVIELIIIDFMQISFMQLRNVIDQYFPFLSYEPFTISNHKSQSPILNFKDFVFQASQEKKEIIR